MIPQFVLLSHTVILDVPLAPEAVMATVEPLMLAVTEVGLELPEIVYGVVPPLTET